MGGEATVSPCKSFLLTLIYPIHQIVERANSQTFATKSAEHDRSQSGREARLPPTFSLSVGFSSGWIGSDVAIFAHTECSVPKHLVRGCSLQVDTFV